MWEEGVYAGNSEIIVISDIFKVSLSVYFVSEDQPPTVIVGQAVAEKKMNPSCLVVNYTKNEVRYF